MQSTSARSERRPHGPECRGTDLVGPCGARREDRRLLQGRLVLEPELASPAKGAGVIGLARSPLVAYRFRQPLCGTVRHAVLSAGNMSGMTSQPEITQRDLRNRSREIMDAVERGQAFTVTRDGHRIGELIPLRRRRRFVTREEFATMSRGAPSIDLDAFRADQEAALDQRATDPYDR